ncbi:MAG: hypothetical protein AB8B80_09210 [Marinicellaceae bacterium]
MKNYLMIMLIALFGDVSANKTNFPNQEIIQLQKAQLHKLLNTQKHGSMIVTVGNTGDCNFNVGENKIQDAIDSRADEIRVIEGTYNENITIENRDLVLKGGYATCADALNDNQIPDSINTIINAAAFGSTIKILGNTQRNDVTLDHIQVTGGAGDLNTFGSGILFNNADVAVNLNHIWIADNTYLFGGGISIIGGDTDIFASNMMVTNNSASFGGGIYCDGNTGLNSLFIYGDSDNGFGISGNQATSENGGGDGGGVYLSNGCVFTSYVGTSGGFLDFRGISVNTATRHGGGIYASSGSKVNLTGFQECALIFCFGYDSEPVNVSNNIANSDEDFEGNGGGIYAIGTETEINVLNGLISFNQAFNGGGVLASDSATFYTNSVYKKNTDCWSPGSCNQITDNLAIRYVEFPASLGGAFYSDNGGNSMIHRTHVQRNRADSATAVYIAAFNTNFSLTSEGSLFTGNGVGGASNTNDRSVFIVNGTSELELLYATIADNNPVQSVLNNASGTLIVKSSIIHETNNDALVFSSITGEFNNEFSCVVVHENLSFDGPTAIADDPDFIDRANDNYHINWETSPAVDLCEESNAPPSYTDIDNQQRGWDWPDIANVNGSYDAGFDEQNDVIFADGFQ